MPRKKVDPRIRTLIENGVKLQHRSVFVIVGDKGKDQVANLHYILSKAQVKTRPTALWCYKKDLGFTTHKKKRIRQIKKLMMRGLYDPNKEDPFELFISSTNIRWCYYRDTHKILGSTYGMCVLQDFETFTPNLLARTVETVEGGGLIIILLKTMRSLKQLYAMSMDVHSRYRTASHDTVVARFNERFLLSLAGCSAAAVVDDELNLLPVSRHARNIQPVVAPGAAEGDGVETTWDREGSAELRELQDSLKETQPIGALVGAARTVDQAKAILTFTEAISEKTLRSTVSLTAARGRGKSAALGLALAAAIGYGYSNIFLTAPGPENLGTVFEFVFAGLKAMAYKEHIDYEAIQSTNPEFNRAIVRVNVFRAHRQTIQFVLPQHHEKLAQAELLAVDEAAAIPLPVMRRLLGPYLVFLASTINGYEGTGRSLSLKLLSSLRKATAESSSGAMKAAVDAASGGGAGSTMHTARSLREVTLEEPIRYARGDPVESWLYDLLCLNATKLQYRIVRGTPHPSECELFVVNRDALFSYHKVSETFLQRLMSLYVASHYRNTPNDLQLLSDAPAHRLFVLLGPVNNDGELPDILCVVQVALEGGISRQLARTTLSHGERSSGDMIPWTIAQQYQDNDFAGLNGARIVRIATHPDVQRMGYGSRALELVLKYYGGELQSLDENDSDDGEDAIGEGDSGAAAAGADDDDAALLTERLRPRKGLPPLLRLASESRAPRLHYVGTAFGVTETLFTFWERAGFRSLYLRQTTNPLTGEHSTIMLRPLQCSDLPSAPAEGWLAPFQQDFRGRFLSLLGSAFRTMPVSLALSIANNSSNKSAKGKRAGAGEAATPTPAPLTASEMGWLLSPHDLKRLNAYARNMVDYHMIVDLLPTLARFHFCGRLPSVSLSFVQAALLLGIGLQFRTMNELTKELSAPSSQLMALFNKAVRKLSTALRALQEADAEEEMRGKGKGKGGKKGGNSRIATAAGEAKRAGEAMVPLAGSLDAELATEGAAVSSGLATKQQAMLDSLDLMKYAVGGTDEAWDEALAGGAALKGGVVSVAGDGSKRKRKKTGDGEASAATPQKPKKSGKKGKKSSRKKARKL